MKKILTTLLTLLFAITTHAGEPAQIMLMGTFHFSNPGKDTVKVDKPGERIIAIGGSGHMAILKQLLAIDQRLAEEKVDGYF